MNTQDLETSFWVKSLVDPPQLGWIEARKEVDLEDLSQRLDNFSEPSVLTMPEAQLEEFL